MANWRRSTLILGACLAAGAVIFGWWSSRGDADIASRDSASGASADGANPAGERTLALEREERLGSAEDLRRVLHTAMSEAVSSKAPMSGALYDERLYLLLD